MTYWDLIFCNYYFFVITYLWDVQDINVFSSFNVFLSSLTFMSAAAPYRVMYTSSPVVVGKKYQSQDERICQLNMVSTL